MTGVIIQDIWPYLTAGLSLLLSLAASGHAIIYKRDSRSAVAWVGIIWLVPFIGAFLYVLLGINRIKRRAVSLRNQASRSMASAPENVCAPNELAKHLPARAHHLVDLARLGSGLTHLDLLRFNRIEPMINGDEAYPAMLEAIEQAERSVTLVTYIFGSDRSGRRFVDALAAAVKRGVEVRVLVDAVGARYSFPPVSSALRRAGVPRALFMRTLFPWFIPYFNLRTHRKIMVVDGRIGFTGGMNIRDGNVLCDDPAHPTQDLHFRVEGPVVREMQETFADDWLFTTREALEGDLWFPDLQPAGEMLARGIPDGPDKDIDKMRLSILGALSTARHSVRIATPYFLPDAGLISMLNTTAMRGVDVQILLPEVNNLKMVHWAAMAQMWQVLQWGCKVWLTPPPFDHGKVMIVDQAWTLIGSANWDPRSLRLNFEFGVECFHEDFALRMTDIWESKRSQARPLTPGEVNGRPLPAQLRDGLARLFAPYL